MLDQELQVARADEPRAGDIAAFATALIGALTALGRRRAAKRPPARHDA
ncbi:hypothetical protein J5Y04_15660 [Kitasatospora sp. RG8]|nr:hypothetical protein [Kitasatospora sp. RG8]MBP0450969.1 hypothetical protein [Kitasatospora sp. RG8]